MTTKTTEIQLSAENKQNLEMPKLFYNYLKEKYGVGEEVINPVNSIFCSIQVNLPGFSKNSEEHTWSIHLELTHLEGNLSEDASCLIIGERCSNERHAWSRFAEMQSGALRIRNDEEGYARCWFKIIRNMKLEKNYLENFKDIAALCMIISEFQKEL
jgi:hypothetical protein